MTGPLLSVQDLSVAFRSRGPRGELVENLAVDRVSFDIGPGETVALVGESGSGKSVTALSIPRLLPYPAAHHPGGRILFDGRDLLLASESDLLGIRGRDITMVFQEPMTSLNPVMRVAEQIEETFAAHKALTPAQRR